ETRECRQMPRPRVLLIDSRTAQVAFGIGLEDAGFEVLVAGDTVEAPEILSQRRCALVLADYQLPGTNGLDLLAALRRAYPKAPLILYSASMTPDLAGQARDSAWPPCLRNRSRRGGPRRPCRPRWPPQTAG